MSDDRFPAASDARDELVKARRRLAALIESHPSRTWPVPLINAVISVVEAQGLPAQVVSSSARQSCDRCGAAEYAPPAPTESTATASDVMTEQQEVSEALRRVHRLDAGQSGLVTSPLNVSRSTQRSLRKWRSRIFPLRTTS